MLGNSTRKKLRQHDLLTLINKDSNPTQARNRIRAKANAALKDLLLLSNQTPSYLVEEFFPTTYILSLLNSLLGLSSPQKQSRKLDRRTSALAAALAERALMACIGHHKLLFENTEALAEPILSHLNNTISICRDLAYKIELIEQDKIAFDENMMYLFDWTKISQKGMDRLSNYINREMEIPVDDIFIERMEDKFINLFLSILGNKETILASITIKGKDSARLDVDLGKGSKVTNILDIKERNGSRYVFGRKTINKQ